MTFYNIVLKNLKFNFKKFISYIFVNIFVIAILFTYGSIVFNKKITEDPILSSTMDFVNMGIVAILLFSIVFISYTGIYFIKTRGKELGVYLTLGMTKKDLTKMIILESTVIMLISVIFGMLIGFLFSGFFYLILSKVLDSENLFYIDGYSFLLSLGVFFIVFLSNVIFSVIFLKGTNITQITKSDKTKGMKSPKKLSGFFGIFLFLVSTIMLYLIFTDSDLVDSLSDNMTKVILFNVTLQFISLYFLLASGLDFLVAIISKNKNFYNNNILILSNLKYSFVTYKTTLYMVTLLMGMSVLFMGVQLSFKYGTLDIMNNVLAYDFMVESCGDINNITKEDIKTIVSNNNGEIREYVTYPYLTTEIYRENSEWLYNYGITTMIISESNFNLAFGTDIDLAKDELLYVSNMNENFGNEVIDFDTFLVPDYYGSGEIRAQKIRRLRPSREDFYTILEDENVDCITYNKENTSTMFFPFINSYGEVEYSSVLGNIIDDEVYNSILSKEEGNIKLFNITSGDEIEIYNDLLTFKNVNGDETKIEGKNYTPISKSRSIEMTNTVMGMFTFTMTFISILFLISSSVVMYYKLVNDTEYEKEQISLYTKIGINSNECKRYLNSHMAILFFTPLILGGSIGLFYNFFFFYNIPTRDYLMKIVLIMYLGFVIYDILFYCVVKKLLVKKIVS
ncbi:MAG: FtsX-like permease family protein [Lachnospirales bacterium]